MAAVFKHSPTDFLHREAVWNRKWYFWALTDRQWSPWSSVQYSEAEPSRRPPSQHLTLPVYLSATRCENACMCMYIPIIVPSTPPNLTSLFFCPPPTAQHAPNPDMARFLISPLLASWVWEEQDHSLRSSLSPLVNYLSPRSVINTVYGPRIAIYPPCSFACCWPYHVRSILPLPALSVCLSCMVNQTALHHTFCWF